jgi:Tol biopolymer transport system component
MAIASDIRYRTNRPIFAGCDWYLDSSKIVMCPIQYGKTHMNHQDLWLRARVGNDFTKLTSEVVGEVNYSPSTEPNRGRIAFLSVKISSDIRKVPPYEGMRLCVQNMNSKDLPTVLISKGIVSAQPLWSPKGRIILISTIETKRASRVKTHVLDADTGTLRTIVLPDNVSFDADHASWSPDGKWILFGVGRPEGSHFIEGVWAYHPSDGSVNRLVPINVPPGPTVYSAVWAPDGNSIAFAQLSEGRTGSSGGKTIPARAALIVMDVRNKVRKSVYSFDPLKTWIEDLVWSPDGKWIAFWQRKTMHTEKISKLLRVSVVRPHRINVLQPSNHL